MGAFLSRGPMERSKDSMKANIKTISGLTGFSPATVSNALNNKRGVNKDTAEKIFKTAREIGYLDGQRVTGVKLVIYRKNGFVVNDSPFFSSLMAGVEAECRSFGFDCIFCHIDQDSPSYDEEMGELLNDASSALLILATEMDPAEAAKFQNALGPVVMLDNWYEGLGCSAVLIDNTDAACRAVEYLIQKGHRRIGHLRGSSEIKNFYYRKLGYQRALQEHGLSLNPAYTFTLTPSMEGACGDMAALLEERPELPTAFFADNDMIALGAMRALQQHGFRIPQDVSVVGFDDLPFCSISTPPLTTVKVYNRQMGCAAVRRLMQLAEYGNDYCTKTQITSGFVERDSVRDLRAPTDENGKQDQENKFESEGAVS